jgi:hypothetical protein
VEATGHLATVHAGVGGGLSGGLAALRIDFGDGRSLQLDEDQLARLRPSGRVSVVHTYQPTLTPEPQTVTVTAEDGSGRTHERLVRFTTRAEYRLTYSPLTVTAKEKCDRFDIHGDFELTWRLDSRPARFSRFKLARGFSYVEDGFRVGVSGIHYDQAPEFFEVTIEEKDPPGAAILGFFFDWPEFRGPPGPQDPFFARGPVAQLGSHQYQVTMAAYASNGHSCLVEMTFTAYLAMVESLDR